MNEPQPPAVWYSPRIPTYWFCFAIAFGLIALIPLWTTTTRSGGNTQTILAAAYTMNQMPWRQTLICHTMAATLAATFGTILVHRESKNNRVARTFTIRSLLLVTLLVAIVAGILRHLASDPLVLGCAMFPILVYPLACFLAVRFQQ